MLLWYEKEVLMRMAFRTKVHEPIVIENHHQIVQALHKRDRPLTIDIVPQLAIHQRPIVAQKPLSTQQDLVLKVLNIDFKAGYGLALQLRQAIQWYRFHTDAFAFAAVSLNLIGNHVR
mgnify:CR=1 FL=1